MTWDRRISRLEMYSRVHHGQRTNNIEALAGAPTPESISMGESSSLDVSEEKSEQEVTYVFRNRCALRTMRRNNKPSLSISRSTIPSYWKPGALTD